MSPIIITIFRNVPVVKVTGIFHLVQAREFAELIRYFLNSGRNTLVVDLTTTEEIQSSGLAALSSAITQLEAQGGRMVIIAPRDKAASWHIDAKHLPGQIIVCYSMEEAEAIVKKLDGEINGQ